MAAGHGATRWATPALLLLAMALLAGCGSGGTAAAGTTSTTTAAGATTIPAAARDSFLRDVRGQYPQLVTVPDAVVVDLSLAACRRLAAGASARDLAAEVLAAETDSTMTQAYPGILRAGVKAFCPGEAAAIDAPAGGTGG